MNRKKRWAMYLEGLLTLSLGIVLMIIASIGIASTLRCTECRIRAKYRNEYWFLGVHNREWTDFYQ